MAYRVRLLACITAVVGSSAGAQLHCGSLDSPSGRLTSGLTLRSGQHRDYITGYVCDRTASCDIVYKGPVNSKVMLYWGSTNSLVFVASGGRLLAANSFHSSGSGRPPVELRLVPLKNATAKRDKVLVFERSRCVSEAPIIDVSVDPTKH
jgi:hypothetical protein